MRSSKSRSRSKSNRPRTLGNITNRVFDSSGPEGKVRGTPQQIIDKYILLARDAQLSNDRVNAENFLQHAEHYTRMLGEAMREMQAEQEQRRQQDSQNQQNNQNQQRDRQQDRSDGQQPDVRDDRNEQRNDNRRDDRNDNRNENRPENRSENRTDSRRDDRNEQRNENRRDRTVQRSDDASNTPEVIEVAESDEDTGLVETPEASRPARRAPNHRTPRPKMHSEADATQPAAKADAAAPQEAEPVEPEGKPRAPRKPRVPRRPKPEAVADAPSATSTDDQAAE